MDCSRCGTPALADEPTCRVCAAPLAQVSAQPAPADAAPSMPPDVPYTPPAMPPHAEPAASATAPALITAPAPITPVTPAASPYAAYGASAGYPAPQGYPGYPGYPGQASSAAYSSYYAAYAAYAHQYASASMAAYLRAHSPQPRPKGETYRQVLGALVIAGSALMLVVGILLALVLTVMGGTATGSGLDGLSTITGLAIATIGGGAAGIYFGITALMRRPSVRFSLPPAWLWLALTVIVLAAGVVLWHTEPAPGGVFAVLPLVLLAGALPALTILAYGAWLLGFPSTWRHTMLSLIHGATLAVVLAAVLEAILLLVIVLALGLGNSSLLSDLNNLNPSNGTEVLALFLTLSVVAPLVEEGLKPLGAILVMSRVRGPAEAFLLGLAAGVGFDFVETVGYFGMGQADWIAVAIDRIGAGLLHGVGAGMAALGWYYLLRGKGVSHRWLRGFGGIAYAVLQHAIFNGSNLLVLVPGPIGKVVSLPLYLGRLPLGGGTIPVFALYIIIFGVFTVVALRLGRAARASAVPQPGAPSGGASDGTPGGASGGLPTPEPVAGGAR